MSSSCDAHHEIALYHGPVYGTGIIHTWYHYSTAKRRKNGETETNPRGEKTLHILKYITSQTKSKIKLHRRGGKHTIIETHVDEKKKISTAVTLVVVGEARTT